MRRVPAYSSGASLGLVSHLPWRWTCREPRFHPRQTSHPESDRGWKMRQNGNKLRAAFTTSSQLSVRLYSAVAACEAAKNLDICSWSRLVRSRCALLCTEPVFSRVTTVQTREKHGCLLLDQSWTNICLFFLICIFVIANLLSWNHKWFACLESHSPPLLAQLAEQAKAMEIKIISYVGQDLDVGLRSGLIGSDPLLRAELAMGLTLSITKPPVQCLMGIFENFFLKTWCVGGNLHVSSWPRLVWPWGALFCTEPVSGSN